LLSRSSTNRVRKGKANTSPVDSGEVSKLLELTKDHFKMKMQDVHNTFSEELR
jgi:hypothetical protein